MSFYPVTSGVDVLSLTGAEIERNDQLVELIRQLMRTAERHAISFATFMELALYHPQYGYYMTADEVFGEAGDFTTAPELGPLFGQFMAAKLADTIQSQNIPARIYEFGAGSGQLAVQILDELQHLNCPVDEYTIVEISPRLRARQRQTIEQQGSSFSNRVRWCDSLPDLECQGIVIANEVVDALPVELICISDGEVLQGFIIDNKGDLALEFQKPQDLRIQQSFADRHIDGLEDGYQSELHLDAETWLQQVAEKLAKGSILISDYGFPENEYYHPDRRTGTLMCHRRHHILHDPLTYIGCQDITAHVNFSALARTANECGFDINGFTNLAGFIVDCGLDHVDLSNLSTAQRVSVSQQLNTLTSPAEMGELFKVIELTRGIDAGNLGFRTLDHLHRL